MNRVTTLELVDNVWRPETTTWDEVLQKEHSQTRLVFSTSKDVEGTTAAETLRNRLFARFKIPPFLFSGTCLLSNGFSGCEPILGNDGNLAHYNHWSRFVIKQTYEILRSKPSFIRCSAGLDTQFVPIHNPESIAHGWQWYEMSFFVHWTPPFNTTVICFDLPQHLQDSLYSALISKTEDLDFTDPYSIFLVLFYGIISLYDSSVWSIRNHICAWEAERSEEPDYRLLHEIARHGIHVSETLAVASQSIKDIQQQHRDFMSIHARNRNDWFKNYSPFFFPLRVLDGLLSRSESNKARLQNEIQLAFHIAAERDSRIQVLVGEEAQKEASAMKSIAVVTMIFLPPTFVSSIFSMSFFHFEPAQSGGSSFAVSSQFWIYWVFAIPLSLLAIILWFYQDILWTKKGSHLSGTMRLKR